MPITERTLKKWRQEALGVRYTTDEQLKTLHLGYARTQAERILRMTQELLDQHLLRKVVK